MDFSKFDPTLLLMGGVLVVLVVFMIRNSRKRKRDAEEMMNKVRPGVEVMTNFGLYGKIKSIDDVENKVVLETSPGQTMTVHRQTIARVVDSPAVSRSMGESIGKDVADVALNPEKEAGKLAIDPQYGERVTDAKPKKKPAPRKTTGGNAK